MRKPNISNRILILNFVWLVSVFLFLYITDKQVRRERKKKGVLEIQLSLKTNFGCGLDNCRLIGLDKDK